MSYNKVEALREKSIAEKLMVSNDYIGARDKLKKAQQLFPGLDHIISMLTVCEILSASNTIIPGYEIDYYWVLQLMPSSTITDITSQYNKLVSLLQPIKYKFPATEMALKLLQEAFSILSDKKKRVTFDIKRGTSWMDYESYESNPEKSRNGDKVCVNNNSLQESGSSSSDLISEGHKGQDMDTRVDELNSASELTFAQKGVLQQDFFDFDNLRSTECFESGDIWAVHHLLTEPRAGSRYARINNTSGFEFEVSWLKPIPVSEGERRWSDAGLAVACGSFCLDTETTGKVSSLGVFSYKCSWDSGVTEEIYEIYPKKGEVWAVYQDFDLDEWSYNPEIIKGCLFKLVEILSDYSIYTGVECCQLVEVNGFKSVFERKVKGENEDEDEQDITLHLSPRELYMLSHKVPSYRFTGGEIDGIHSGMFELDQFSLRNQKSQQIKSQTMPEDKDSNFSIFPQNPEPTFLGPNWSATVLTAGEVWAVYAKDSMPRKYVLINNMVSNSQLSVTFLEPESLFDHEASWKNRSLPISCGMFRANGTLVNLDKSQLSHQVNCQKSTTTPVYKILPSKGEIWAVYKNWKNNWNRVSYENCKYWVVEVLSDGEKTTVARLVEVKGCLTFFQRQQCEDGFEMIRGISRNEMLCFSHQIPAYRVPGIGGHGIPENCWHLEPLALPLKNAK